MIVDEGKQGLLKQVPGISTVVFFLVDRRHFPHPVTQCVPAFNVMHHLGVMRILEQGAGIDGEVGIVRLNRLELGIKVS